MNMQRKTSWVFLLTVALTVAFAWFAGLLVAAQEK